MKNSEITILRTSYESKSQIINPKHAPDVTKRWYSTLLLCILIIVFPGSMKGQLNFPCPDNIVVPLSSTGCSVVVNYTEPVLDCSVIPEVPGFTCLGNLGSTYYFLSDATANAPTAFLNAENMGGFLATIPDAQTNDFLRTAANDAGFGGAFLIGFNDGETEGTFEWHSLDPVTYTNWRPGQPAGTTPPEDFVVMQNTGLWNDILDTQPRRYVVEVDIEWQQTGGLPSGSEFPAGGTFNTFKFTSPSGEIVACDFAVTVIDDTPPALSCPPDIVVDTNPGLCTALVVWPDPVAIDNCVQTQLLQVGGSQSGSEFPVGVHTITYIAFDNFGNQSSCSFSITVVDNEAPIALCEDITIQLDEMGIATLTATDVLGVNTDNCGVASSSIDIGNFDCSSLGDTLVTVTTTDINGNSTACSAIVTIEDNTPPAVQCQDITVQLDANGMVVIEALDIEAGSTDACGIAGYSLSQDTFGCAQLGVNMVTLIATDVNNNTGTCEAMVTVVDDTAPLLECPIDQTVLTDPSNNLYTLPDYRAIGEATATDNCTDPVTVVTQNPAADTELSPGIYTITITAEDESTNANSCSFELTVETSLSVDERHISEQLILSPNPASGRLTVQSHAADHIRSLQLYDMEGRLVQEFSFSQRSNMEVVDIAQVPTGLYLVYIQLDHALVLKKLIKK